MKDFLGKELFEGDKVIAIFPNGCNLEEAIVIKVTQKTALILKTSYLGTPYESFTSRVYSQKLVKV